MKPPLQQFIAAFKVFRDGLLDIPKNLSALREAVEHQTSAIDKASEAAQKHYESPPMVRAELYIPESEKNVKKRDHVQKKWLNRLKTFLEALTLAAVVWYAWEAHLQRQAMLEANRINHASLVVVQRAFVYFSGFQVLRTINPITKKQIALRFIPQWNNSGNTPATKTINYVNSDWRPQPLPEGFDFADKPVRDVFPVAISKSETLIAPHTFKSASPLDIPQEQIDKLSKGNEFIYFWGWTSYFTVQK